MNVFYARGSSTKKKTACPESSPLPNSVVPTSLLFWTDWFTCFSGVTVFRGVALEKAHTSGSRCTIPSSPGKTRFTGVQRNTCSVSRLGREVRPACCRNSSVDSACLPLPLLIAGAMLASRACKE
ncbi:unnamed protein product, partial [Hapterophycus canaliculatus]